MFKISVRIGALALALVTVACGDSPSCEDALNALAKRMPADDRPSADDLAQTIKMCKDAKWSGDVRTCVSKASSDKTAMDCLAKAKPKDRDEGDGVRKRKRNEAELNLNAIEKAAKVEFVMNDQFPVLSQPLTPATSCCEAGNGGKCKNNPADWNGVPAWDTLDFMMVEDHYFRYSYESSDGKTMVARAVGDLDCDGTEVTYELRGTVVGGVAKFELTEPSNAD